MTRKLLSTIVILLLGVVPLLAYDGLDSAGEKKPSGAYGGPSYLGVDVDDVSPARAQVLKLNGDTGVEITMVDRDAPAGKAGLQAHDVILKFNNTDVESVEQVRRLLRETPAGRVVTLTISRDGKLMPVQVTLAQRREELGYSFAMPPMTPMTPMPPVEIPAITMPRIEIPQVDLILHQYSPSGLMLENLTPQLRGFFGVKSSEGVLVRSVEKGSTAEKVGFKAGDVIVRVGQHRINDVGDWRTSLSMGTGTVPVSIYRDKKPQTITLPVPRKRDSSTVWPGDESFTINTEQLRSEMAALRPQFEQMRKELASKQFRDSMRHAQDEVRRHMEQLRRELDQQHLRMISSPAAAN